ncbi:hypothetical protein X805_10090 [Sphaerotilus natans subsp. natans DSM 6575]|uniref:Uncharacterized protein n=1 Tax=Sphaerotilus natans subsp. natans DSM 6575 TaxID=1286631 RepID=A0A059KQC1_9BURK|nr:hypothetical protein X805_10090 [Sphaerotilus natans subsp. natans DSM 6575]
MGAEASHGFPFMLGWTGLRRNCRMGESVYTSRYTSIFSSCLSSCREPMP